VTAPVYFLHQIILSYHFLCNTFTSNRGNVRQKKPLQLVFSLHLFLIISHYIIYTFTVIQLFFCNTQNVLVLKTKQKVQAVLVVCNFASTWLENLYHFSNLQNEFRFNLIWHTWHVTALIFCTGLAESDSHCHAIRQAWTGYVGDIITWLMQLPLQRHWLLLPQWVTNINLSHPV